ncbi:MAG: DUF3570 domain-containing protein [Planctomycetota bacterium]
MIALVGALAIGSGLLAQPVPVPAPEPTAAPADPSDTPAHGGEAGHGSLQFRLGYYDSDDSGDGNPFLDESLTVIEPVVVLDYNVTDRLSLSGTFSYDSVSSASIDRLSRYPDQSGATGDDYFGISLGLSYRWSDDWRLGGHGSFSSEYDYNSIGAGVFVAHDLADRNATIKLDFGGFFDTVDIIRFDGTEEGDDDRTTLSTGITWYQIVDPKTHFEVGTVVAHQTGFLETPYNAVVIEDDSLAPNPALENLARGREIIEELPDSRTRLALHGRVRRAFTRRTAVELGSRIYTDTWGVTGLSLEPSLHHWLVQERLRVRLRYRFYTQTAADDFEEHVRTETRFRTQDSDLADFTSHMVGVRFDWQVTDDFRWDIGADYLLRSDGLDQVILSLGFRWEF